MNKNEVLSVFQDRKIHNLATLVDVTLMCWVEEFSKTVEIGDQGLWFGVYLCCCFVKHTCSVKWQKVNEVVFCVCSNVSSVVWMYLWFCLDLIGFDWIWLDLFWIYMIWFDLIWFNLIWFDRIWFDLIWFDLTWLDLTWLDLTWLDLTWLVLT